MSCPNLQAVIFAIALLSNDGVAIAQQRSPLKPSPDLFAADIYRLIQVLKATNISDNRLNSAEALYKGAKAIGLASDLSPTIQAFIQASAAHDAEATKDLLAKMSPFELGEAAYVLHNYGVAQKYWLGLAQAGDIGAEVNVGLMYSGGSNGATQSDTETFKWYRLASIQGSEVAQENLAVLYQEGRGVAQNTTEAFVWLSLAAQQAVKEGHIATSVALIKRRDILAQALNSDALEHALNLVQQCLASQYKDCE